MKCPHCNVKSKVLATRGSLRTYECPGGHRFRTDERIVEYRDTAGRYRKVAQHA